MIHSFLPALTCSLSPLLPPVLPSPSALPPCPVQMFHVSPEFSSLRSLALVAASHRLQQLLPLTTPSSPLPPSPCLRAPSPLPTTQEGKLYPADSTYPRPKSVVASCQRLAAFYSTQFAEGPLPAAPPSLEVCPSRMLSPAG